MDARASASRDCCSLGGGLVGKLHTWRCVGVGLRTSSVLAVVRGCDCSGVDRRATQEHPFCRWAPCVFAQSSRRACADIVRRAQSRCVFTRSARSTTSTNFEMHWPCEVRQQRLAGRRAYISCVVHLLCKALLALLLPRSQGQFMIVDMQSVARFRAVAEGSASRVIQFLHQFCRICFSFLLIISSSNLFTEAATAWACTSVGSNMSTSWAKRGPIMKSPPTTAEPRKQQREPRGP